MPLPRGEDAWFELARAVVAAYVASELAVIWPEVESRLGETGWITTNYDSTFPATAGIQPHILHRARTVLVAEGVLVPDAVTLSGRRVTAYLDGPGLAGRNATRIGRAAAEKRRLYRSFLGWAGNAQLCGHVAEQVVDASLRSLAGRYVWLGPETEPGQVTHLAGVPVPIGPLDSSGFIPFDRSNPTAGLTAFAAEVKNVRSVVYSWSHEAWDLLAKLGDFPDVVPVFFSRRIHLTTFRMFKDLGAIGSATYRQWFFNRGTDRANIDTVAFDRARSTFGFHDAELLTDPAAPQPLVVKFFTDTVRTPVEGQPLIARQSERWARSSAIVRDYTALRDENLDWDERRELMTELASRIDDEGLLEAGGWAPLTV